MAVDLANNPGLVAALGGIPAAIPTAVLFYQWWIGRSDKNKQLAMQFEDARDARRQKELDEQASLLSKEQERIFALMRADLEGKNAEIVQLKAEKITLGANRDRGWDLARWWNRLAHELWHEMDNARQMVNSLLEHSGGTVPQWRKMDVPLRLEDPETKGS